MRDDVDQSDLPGWQESASTWAGVVGFALAVIGFLACAIAVFEGGVRLGLLPATIFLVPATIHIAGAIGIAESRRWAWWLELTFSILHLLAFLAATVLAIRFATVGFLNPNLVAIALPCLFGSIGIAPLGRIVYCLYRCRELTGHDEINRPAFEVIPRGSADP